MDMQLLNQHVEGGIVKAAKHPTLPLTLYNYSDECQYGGRWDDVSLQCRGLVMHGDKVVARPFRKFKNDVEYSPGEIPWHLPCAITEKLDGSLLIVFHFGGEWHACTRGSFTSEQAIRGLDILKRKYSTGWLWNEATYCLEVLYPENRVVVDYGGLEDVIQLAVFHTESGRELALSDHLPQVRRLPFDTDVRNLRTLIRDNEEGYVVRFQNGFRMKVKGERYLELHKIFSGVSSRMVWEYLSEDKPFTDLLAVVPDEFAQWVRKERDHMLAQYALLEYRTEWAVKLAKERQTRKEQAAFILENFKDVSSAAFTHLDGKPYAKTLWKQLYPEFRRPTSGASV